MPASPENIGVWLQKEIERLNKEHDLSMSDIARLTEVSPQYVSQVKSTGKASNKFFKAFTSLKQVNYKEPNEADVSEQARFTKVPFLEDMVALGGSGETFDDGQHNIRYDLMDIKYKGCYNMVVSGDSMYSTYQHGDKLTLREADKSMLLPGEVYAFQLSDNQRTVKRVYKGEKEGHIKLCPDNKDGYSDIEIPLDKVSKVFKIERLERR